MRAHGSRSARIIAIGADIGLCGDIAERVISHRLRRPANDGIGRDAVLHEGAVAVLITEASSRDLFPGSIRRREMATVLQRHALRQAGINLHRHVQGHRNPQLADCS